MRVPADHSIRTLATDVRELIADVDRCLIQLRAQRVRPDALRALEEIRDRLVRSEQSLRTPEDKNGFLISA